MLLACTMCALAVHFAMPDLWVRNVGALLRLKEGRPTGRPLLISGIVLFLTAFPFVVLALALLNTSRQVVHSVELATMAHSLRQLVLGANLTARDTWWLVGGFLCISITAINTWLIAIAQHWSVTRNETSQELVRLTPFVAALIGVIGSVFVDGHNYVAFGAIGTLLAFGNVAVLIVACLQKRTVSAAGWLRVYYATGSIVTLALFMMWRTQLQTRIHEVILWQAAVATIFGLTLIVRRAGR
jgi:hypothetical protein